MFYEILGGKFVHAYVVVENLNVFALEISLSYHYDITMISAHT